MVPGVEAFTPFAWLLTLSGFFGGMVFWAWIGGASGVWGRMTYQAGDVWRLLLTQTGVAAALLVGLLIVGALLGDILGAPFRWIGTLVGIVFWGYVGALALTAVRGRRRT